MKIQLLRNIALVCGALTFCGIGQSTFAQSITSATAQSPITVGQTLRVTCTILNDSWWGWYPIDLDYSCGMEVYSQSEIYLGETDSTEWISPDDSVTLSYIVPASLLPTTPGNYFVYVQAFFNPDDSDYYYTDDSPVIVNFTVTGGANHAPVIAAIADKFVVDTNLLSFTVSATDSDTPAQTLTYSLATGAPSGANINPSTGLFTWTPPAGYAPRTNQISVIVADNGSPAMSATNTFKVVVLKPIRVQLDHPYQGAISLTWESYPGKTYTVQFRDNVASGEWYGYEIMAAENLTCITNVLGNARQRFYRLKLN